MTFPLTLLLLLVVTISNDLPTDLVDVPDLLLCQLGVLGVGGPGSLGHMIHLCRHSSAGPGMKTQDANEFFIS